MDTYTIKKVNRQLTVLDNNGVCFFNEEANSCIVVKYRFFVDKEELKISSSTPNLTSESASFIVFGAKGKYCISISPLFNGVLFDILSDSQTESVLCTKFEIKRINYVGKGTGKIKFLTDMSGKILTKGGKTTLSAKISCGKNQNYASFEMI